MKLVLVRHADAGSRSGWAGPDHLRGLTDKGRAQAMGLLPLLDPHPIERIISSPFLRCLDTITPMASVLQQGIEVAPELAEGADPLDAVKLVRAVADDGLGAVLCSHGDIVPGVLEVLAASDDVKLGRSPQWQKGSGWILSFSGSRATTATYVPPRMAGPG